MTTIMKNGTSVPLDVALERARAEYLAGSTDARKMTTKELEKRQAVVREYYNLLRIARMGTDTIEHATLREMRI